MKKYQHKLGQDEIICGQMQKYDILSRKTGCGTHKVRILVYKKYRNRIDFLLRHGLFSDAKALLPCGAVLNSQEGEGIIPR